MNKNKINKRRIVNFELNELIGSGGMANIYKGVQLSLDRPVAIKLMHPHLTLNEGFVVRFENEAKQAAQLVHPNIVAIIDYGHQGNEYFIAMEYIDGQNLKEIMTRTKRLPLEIALLIARKVVAGLKYAHSNGLIHRDIKPANIMLSSDGRVMITDFGIAKNHNDLSITATGQMIGSPAYMSPEQAAGRPIDHRCDIFSLGIVLYEIITSEKPFKGDTYQEMMTSIISGNVITPSQLRVDVTPEIENVISKAMKKDIESRYQDTEELASDIEHLLESFVIPSPKKLISEFLKNPIRTTEKLRSDRISKHMESALYLVNLGHGRLDDAVKEFENVLRFDKNNKLAKENLERLKLNQIGFNENEPSKIKKLRLRMLVSACAVAVVSILLLIFASGNKLNNESSGMDINNVVNENIATVPLPPAEQSAKLSGFNSNRKADESASSKQKTAQNKSRTVAKSKKNVVKKTSGMFNYPNQNISEYGLLKIVSIPSATFSIDAREYGKTGGPLVKLSPGRHTIIIKARGHKTEKKRIFTEKEKTESINVKLKPEK